MAVFFEPITVKNKLINRKRYLIYDIQIVKRNPKKIIFPK